MNNLMMLLGASGLGGLKSDLIQNWIGPAFFIVVAAFAIKFIISRQFRELAGFLAIGAVVALLIFGGEGLFGAEGIFTKIAQAFSTSIGNGGSSSGGGGMIKIINILIR